MDSFRCLAVFLLVVCIAYTCEGGPDFYSFEVTDIHGTPVSLEKYRGMITLVVNVASECGFTDRHYKGLVRVHHLLGETGKFSVLAFPSNQFGAQEPKENHDIFKFAQENYQVNFPMFSKLDVIDSTAHEAWAYLSERSGQTPNWNFWKYLVDKDGQVVESWGPWSDVEEIFPTIKNAVDTLLQAQGPPKPPRGVEEQIRDQPGGNEVGIESGSAAEQGSSAGFNPNTPNLAKMDKPKPPPPPPKDPLSDKNVRQSVKPPPPPQRPGSASDTKPPPTPQRPETKFGPPASRHDDL